MSCEDSVHFGNISVRTFGDVLRRVVRDKKFYQRGRYGALLRAWENVAGPEIFASTRIISYEHGRLIIGVNSPVLLHSLKGFMRHSILEELRKTEGCGDVNDVLFLAG